MVDEEEDQFIKENPIIFKKYKVSKKLGEGAFGDVYLGKKIDDGSYVAIKVEQRKIIKPILETEAFLLYSIAGLGIPEVKSFGKVKNYNILVEPLLGKSLFDIYTENHKEMPMGDVCLIALQVIDRIQWVHSKYIVHRDIKPDNFLIGRKDPNVIYLIDFGLSKKYRSSTTNKHIRFGFTGKLTGTVRFASANALRGGEQSRRDDIESIGYMLVYFLKKKLPWQGITGNKKMERYLKIYKLKKNTSPEELCSGLPPEMAVYMEYAKSLEFEQEPDYNLLRKLFKQMLKRINNTNDILVFSWIKLKDLPNLKNPVNPATRKDSPQSRIYKKIKSNLEKERNLSSDSDSKQSYQKVYAQVIPSNSNLNIVQKNNNNFTESELDVKSEKKLNKKLLKTKEGLNTTVANLEATVDENVVDFENQRMKRDSKDTGNYAHSNKTLGNLLKSKNSIKQLKSTNNENISDEKKLDNNIIKNLNSDFNHELNDDNKIENEDIQDNLNSIPVDGNNNINNDNKEKLNSKTNLNLEQNNINNNIMDNNININNNNNNNFNNNFNNNNNIINNDINNNGIIMNNNKNNNNNTTGNNINNSNKELQNIITNNYDNLKGNNDISDNQVQNIIKDNNNSNNNIPQNNPDNSNTNNINNNSSIRIDNINIKKDSNFNGTEFTFNEKIDFKSNYSLNKNNQEINAENKENQIKIEENKVEMDEEQRKGIYALLTGNTKLSSSSQKNLRQVNINHKNETSKKKKIHHNNTNLIFNNQKYKNIDNIENLANLNDYLKRNNNQEQNIMKNNNNLGQFQKKNNLSIKKMKTNHMLNESKKGIANFNACNTQNNNTNNNKLNNNIINNNNINHNERVLVRKINRNKNNINKQNFNKQMSHNINSNFVNALSKPNSIEIQNNANSNFYKKIDSDIINSAFPNDGDVANKNQVINNQDRKINNNNKNDSNYLTQGKTTPIKNYKILGNNEFFNEYENKNELKTKNLPNNQNYNHSNTTSKKNNFDNDLYNSMYKEKSGKKYRGSNYTIGIKSNLNYGYNNNLNNDMLFFPGDSNANTLNINKINFMNTTNNFNNNRQKNLFIKNINHQNEGDYESKFTNTNTNTNANSNSNNNVNIIKQNMYKKKYINNINIQNNNGQNNNEINMNNDNNNKNYIQKLGNNRNIIIQNPNLNPMDYNPRIIKVSGNKGNSPLNQNKSNSKGKRTTIRKLPNNKGRNQGVNNLISNSLVNKNINNNLINLPNNNINNSQRVNYLMPELNNSNNTYINQYGSKISNFQISPKNSKYSQISHSYIQSNRNANIKKLVNVQFSNTSPNDSNNPYGNMQYNRIPNDNVPNNNMYLYQYAKNY